jgi:hypothetical protein
MVFNIENLSRLGWIRSAIQAFGGTTGSPNCLERSVAEATADITAPENPLSSKDLRP